MKKLKDSQQCRLSKLACTSSNKSKSIGTQSQKHSNHNWVKKSSPTCPLKTSSKCWRRTWLAKMEPLPTQELNSWPTSSRLFSHLRNRVGPPTTVKSTMQSQAGFKRQPSKSCSRCETTTTSSLIRQNITKLSSSRGVESTSRQWRGLNLNLHATSITTKPNTQSTR